MLGAGVAGLVSALELLRAGWDVTVVEAGPFAGGRASSWATPAGLISGTGLHVVGNHYVNLLHVLRAVGATDGLTWWDDHLYLRPGCPPVVWKYNRLPAPFHLARAAVHMPAPITIRVRLARAGFDVLRCTAAELAALDCVPYLEWHRLHRLGDGFVRDLAEIAADAATFLPLERVSARAVLSWLKYMSASYLSGRIGAWRVPLSEGLVAPLVRALEARGGELRVSSAAVDLVADSHGIRQVIVRRTRTTRPWYEAAPRVATVGPPESLACDSVISALPIQYLRALLRPELVDRAGLRAAMALGTVPAISVTMAYDRKIHPSPSGAPLAAGCSIRDLIELPVEQVPPGAGSAFLFLISGADDWLARDDGEIVQMLARDFRAVWPAATGALPVGAVVERIGAAMFAAVPGAHRLRPTTRTEIDNLFVAGDWVRHDLNASLEGAALSGRLAARAVLGGRGHVDVLQPPEPALARAARALLPPKSEVSTWIGRAAQG